MAKKFGKFLLFTAATAATAAGVYYYLQKKGIITKSEPADDEEDFEDFDEDLDVAGTERSYVALNLDAESATEDEFFENLADIVPNADEVAEETVEEFFDEDAE